MIQSTEFNKELAKLAAEAGEMYFGAKTDVPNPLSLNFKFLREG
jgi:hypothetical protein